MRDLLTQFNMDRFGGGKRSKGDSLCNTVTLSVYIKQYPAPINFKAKSYSSWANEISVV